MLRLFFALQPTPEQNAELTAQVAPFIVDRAQPVPAQNLHATLCFVGAVEPARLDDLRAAAAGVRGPSVTLTFDTLELWERPKILCATASQESSSAIVLATALTEATVAAGFSPDIKPFRAHLTLARKVRGDLSVPMPRPLMPPARICCDRFVLMESRREAAASIYSVIESWALYG
jgi:RNA 2',3'-cyclic 3'-phosphodiesterase